MLLALLTTVLGSALHRRPLAGALLLAALRTALASGGLSLDDGSLSLGAALAGERGGSLAAGAPGGLMHDAMTLGVLLSSPPQGRFGLSPRELGQLAALRATAAFSAPQGMPVFCAGFVVTLQGGAAALGQVHAKERQGGRSRRCP